jgi:hypothetical protein
MCSCAGVVVFAANPDTIMLADIMHTQNEMSSSPWKHQTIEIKTIESENLFQDGNNKRKTGSVKQGRPRFTEKQGQKSAKPTDPVFTLFFSSATMNRGDKTGLTPFFDPVLRKSTFTALLHPVFLGL